MLPLLLKILLKLHTNLSLNNKVMGLINCPINKNLLGTNKIGVTEFLAKKCKVKKNSEVMFLRNKKDLCISYYYPFRLKRCL